MPRRKTAVAARSDGQKYLGPAPAERVFWCHAGRIFRDISELGNGLASMSDEMFHYHANDEKNDFASWVKDVIGDQQLANELYRSHTRSDAASAVEKRLSVLTTA